MRFLVRASYLQIYNEQISDLLKPERSNLAIREDRKRGVFVEGLSEWVVRLMRRTGEPTTRQRDTRVGVPRLTPALGNPGGRGGTCCAELSISAGGRGAIVWASRRVELFSGVGVRIFGES